MKDFWKQAILAAALGLGLPAAAVALTLGGQPPQEAEETTTAPSSSADQAISIDQALLIPVRQSDGSVEQMDMESYLTGVVLAEMPTDFEPEALKAQAVVARTYALRRLDSGGKHDGAICMESGCCQGYKEADDFRPEQVDKVQEAVEETDGLVLTYGGELIDATYFSCSGGSTEDAAAVWGTEVPYLQAVESPGEEYAAHDTEQVSFSAEEFAGMLERNLTGSPTDWFGTVTHTKGGGVNSMEIGGETYSGTQLRSMLGLRSTNFAVSIAGDTITIETHGFGHRVGMSQYGADAMAVSGSTCAEILQHYYQGTSLQPYKSP